MFNRSLKNLRSPIDSIGTYSHFNHSNTCAYFRCVQTRHLLYAVEPPGGKTYHAGFVTFSRRVDIFSIYLSIYQPYCPVVGRRPQHVVSKFAYLVLFSARWFHSKSSLHLFAGLPRNLFLPYGFQVVMKLPSRSPATWWQNVPSWLSVVF